MVLKYVQNKHVREQEAFGSLFSYVFVLYGNTHQPIIILRILGVEYIWRSDVFYTTLIPHHTTQQILQYQRHK